MPDLYGDTVFDKTLTLFASDEETASGTFVHDDFLMAVDAELNSKNNTLGLSLIPVRTKNAYGVNHPYRFGNHVLQSAHDNSVKFFGIDVTAEGSIVYCEIDKYGLARNTAKTVATLDDINDTLKTIVTLDYVDATINAAIYGAMEASY